MSEDVCVEGLRFAARTTVALARKEHILLGTLEINDVPAEDSVREAAIPLRTPDKLPLELERDDVVFATGGKREDVELIERSDKTGTTAGSECRRVLTAKCAWDMGKART